jgi:response regulator of citrate/malate metabolism
MTTNKPGMFLADDDEHDCFLFQDALLELNPYSELVIAKDRVEIETLVEKIPPPPYFLFLDINIPRKNGLDCLNEIRNSESKK